MSADFCAINVSDQLSISANPTGIGPPIPIPITFNPLSGFLHVSTACLLGNPLVYPAPLGNVMIGRSADLKLKALPMLYVRSTPDPPTPRDVVLGDPVGPVGIAVNSLIINILNASTINIESPLSFWGGIKNLLGAETITGAKAQTGAEARSGLKTVNGATIINQDLEIFGRLTCRNVDLIGTINVQGWKKFDIPHPTKPDTHRLRYICLEGPEVGAYLRGKLKDSNTIELPEYWTESFIDTESITVNLTPVGFFQELFVKEIVGTKIIIGNNSGSSINCNYTIFAERKLDDKLQVEYEGQSPADYPGDNSQYSLAGWNYDRR